MEFSENIVRKDTFAKLLGITVTAIGDGTAKGEMVLRKEHMNGADIAHGGAIFTLGDTVFGAASNSREGLALAVNVAITFCKAAKEGKLTAVAEEVSLGRKLATYIIRIFDEESDLVALFQGTVYRKSP